MKIPNARPDLRPADYEAILRVLDSGEIAEGSDVLLFEQAFAGRLGDGMGAVAVSNGFAALHLSLLALGVGPGAEVILPCVSTCAAMRNAVMATGATPVYADTQPCDFNLSLESVRSACTARTRAILAPHHTGVAADIPGLMALGIPVVEDAAQALGASWEGRPAGSMGALGAFSFYATKILTTVDGGMVTAGDAEVLDRVRNLRYYREKWDDMQRFNYKMQNLSAAIGLSQLSRLDDMLRRRSNLAGRYRDLFLRHGIPASAILQQGAGDIFFRWAVRLPPPRRVAVGFLLNQYGVPHRVNEMHFLASERELRRFPKALALSQEVLTLPTYPALKEEEILWILESLDHALSLTGRNVPEVLP